MLILIHYNKIIQWEDIKKLKSNFEKNNKFPNIITWFLKIKPHTNWLRFNQYSIYWSKVIDKKISLTGQRLSPFPPFLCGARLPVKRGLRVKTWSSYVHTFKKGNANKVFICRPRSFIYISIVYLKPLGCPEQAREGTRMSSGCVGTPMRGGVGWAWVGGLRLHHLELNFFFLFFLCFLFSPLYLSSFFSSSASSFFFFSFLHPHSIFTL